MMQMYCKWKDRLARQSRKGATAVEFAVVLPAFLAFLFGLFEFGRLQLIVNLMDSASRQAARYGATEGITSAQVRSRVRDMLGAAVDPNLVTVAVKDGRTFDGSGPYPVTISELNALPTLELSTASPRTPFVVYATVQYGDIAILPFSVLSGITLSGRSVMRHE
jgi:Flp pilus assembly protein TadG